MNTFIFKVNINSEYNLDEQTMTRNNLSNSITKLSASTALVYGY